MGDLTEYNRNYYHRVRRGRIVTHKGLGGGLCWVCNSAVHTGARWGAREIRACEPCMQALILASDAQYQRDQAVKVEIGALGLVDWWKESAKKVHLFEKGAEAAPALCGAAAPPGPLYLDFLQPEELRRHKLCLPCQLRYTDPTVLPENQEQFYGYACPVTAPSTSPGTT